MDKLIEQIREKIPYDYFSDTELARLFPESGDRRYALVKRAISKGDLIHLRRGLYCLSEKYRRKPLNLFVLAQKIYGPSYISLESALSYHGWIPEAVHGITSVCAKRSRDFKTPLGNFSYRHVVTKSFLTAVQYISQDKESFLMASPWRALADYVFVYKKDWRGLHPLIYSLRIEEELLKTDRQKTMEELQDIEKVYKSWRIARFISGVRKNLK